MVFLARKPPTADGPLQRRVGLVSFRCAGAPATQYAVVSREERCGGVCQQRRRAVAGPLGCGAAAYAFFVNVGMERVEGDTAPLMTNDAWTEINDEWTNDQWRQGPWRVFRHSLHGELVHDSFVISDFRHRLIASRGCVPRTTWVKVLPGLCLENAERQVSPRGNAGGGAAFSSPTLIPGSHILLGAG